MSYLTRILLVLTLAVVGVPQARAVNVCGFMDALDFSGMKPLPFGGEMIGLGPAGGEIVHATVDVTFTTSGQFHAQDLGVFLNMSSGGGSSFGFTGAQLGWTGQGTFTAHLESDALNGYLDPYGNPWSTWFLDTVNLNPGNGPITGAFDELVFRITYGPCPIGDINRDYNVNIDDLVLVITHWGTCPPRPQSCDWDVNGDHLVNIDDLIAVITHWGTFCPTCQ